MRSSTKTFIFIVSEILSQQTFIKFKQFQSLILLLIAEINEALTFLRQAVFFITFTSTSSNFGLKMLRVSGKARVICVQHIFASNKQIKPPKLGGKHVDNFNLPTFTKGLFAERALKGLPG